MVIDIHTHLWGERFEEDKRELLKAMELYGIDRIYVSGLNGETPDEAEVDEANRQVAAFMAEHPGRVRGYIYVSPENRNAQDVIRRGVEDAGMDGIKLWISRRCDDPCVYPVAELAIRYNIPILIHAFHKANGQRTHESLGENVANLARRYPEAKLIMAHLGGNCYNGIRAVRTLPNVWVDHSDTIFRGDDLPYTLEALGADRILFGSDMPGSYAVNLGQVQALDMDEEGREKILWKNAEKIFSREFRPGGAQ